MKIVHCKFNVTALTLRQKTRRTAAVDAVMKLTHTSVFASRGGKHMTTTATTIRRNLTAVKKIKYFLLQQTKL
jgi:hypothetical protein